MKRTDAMLAGLKFYDTGEPCVNGHTAQRRTMNGCCVQCERERGKDWRSKNKDKRRPSTASKKWIERPGNGPNYERWVRILKAADADERIYQITHARQAVVLKAVGDVLGIQRHEGENVDAYRRRLLAFFTTLPLLP